MEMVGRGSSSLWGELRAPPAVAFEFTQPAFQSLNTSSFGWKFVVEYFTEVKEADGSYRYSVLVFDNRGVGNSTTPSGPYT